MPGSRDNERYNIFYHSEHEVVTSLVFLQNPQTWMYPFKVLIILVKIFIEEVGRNLHSTLCGA